MLSMALQDALTKLKLQERAMAARAEASERLADQIVEGLTSGLVVVDRAGMVQAINPARETHSRARRRRRRQRRFVRCSKPAGALSDLIAEALEGTSPIVRRTITLGGARPRHLGVTVSPIIGERWQSAGRGLPVHRPDGRRRARRAAAPEGGAGAARRAHGGPGARIQERPRHHSRLRPLARSGHAARTGAHLRRTAFAPRRWRSAKWSRTSCASRVPSKSPWHRSICKA